MTHNKLLLLATLLMSNMTSVLAHDIPVVGTPSGYIYGIPIPYNATFPKAFYPYVRIDGCSSLDSLPTETVPDTSYIHGFHDACDNHDRCWGNAANSAIDCDRDFKDEMQRSCAKQFHEESQLETIANIFFTITYPIPAHYKPGSIVSPDSEVVIRQKFLPGLTGAFEEAGGGVVDVITGVGEVVTDVVETTVWAGGVIVNGTLSIGEEATSTVIQATSAIGTELGSASGAAIGNIYSFLDNNGAEVVCWMAMSGTCLTLNAIKVLTGKDYWQDLVDAYNFALSPYKLAACMTMAESYFTAVRLSSGTLKGEYEQDTTDYHEYASNAVNTVKAQRMIPIISLLLL